MRLFLRLLGVCSHTRMTFPQTKAEVTRIVCLDCGREFSYSWDDMQVGAEIR